MVTEPSTLRLTDPGQMRALAHPLRLRLLGLLRSDGPATATELAEHLEVSPALASYHLRQLAAHGFIDEAPDLATDGKQRWWRATHERTSWKTVEFLDTPERVAAEQALGREIARAHADRAAEWVVDASSWPTEWVDASTMSDWILELTPEDLTEMREELEATIEWWAARPRRPDAQKVQAIVHLLPRRSRS
jgi:DNA-binding transcriptional ArsR family regulator